MVRNLWVLSCEKLKWRRKKIKKSEKKSEKKFVCLDKHCNFALPKQKTGLR
ncbi:MAG: hypothetical protein RL329_2778 [Bacteroidota bacterium]|jgi:hypothetical protein